MVKKFFIGIDLHPPHPYRYMSIIGADVDIDIYTTVMLLNLLGFETVFSCQDIKYNGNSFQFVIEFSKHVIFESFLKNYLITYRKESLISGIEFMLLSCDHNKLLSCLITSAQNSKEFIYCE